MTQTAQSSKDRPVVKRQPSRQKTGQSSKDRPVVKNTEPLKLIFKKTEILHNCDHSDIHDSASSGLQVFKKGDARLMPRAWEEEAEGKRKEARPQEKRSWTSREKKLDLKTALPSPSS
jgi:hypothetical protein